MVNVVWLFFYKSSQQQMDLNSWPQPILFRIKAVKGSKVKEMKINCAPSVHLCQESDGEKSDDNLVVDVSNEVQRGLTTQHLFCLSWSKNIYLDILLSVLTLTRIQCLREEVLPTLPGRTGWTRVACWRRMHPWVLPPSPPLAAHLHPNPKRLIW